MRNNPLRILLFALLFIFQAVAGNHLDFGPWIYFCVIPLLIINIPIKNSPNVAMLAAFAIGLALDFATDGVPGLNAAAAVLLAALRKPLYRRWVSIDWKKDGTVPGLQNAGTVKYLFYLFLCTLIYITAYTLLDCFSLRPFWFILGRIAASTVVDTLVAAILGMAIFNRD